MSSRLRRIVSLDLIFDSCTSDIAEPNTLFVAYRGEWINAAVSLLLHARCETPNVRVEREVRPRHRTSRGLKFGFSMIPNLFPNGSATAATLIPPPTSVT